MEYCNKCGKLVDTDFDCEHFEECGAEQEDEEVCQICGGTGEVSCDEWDENSHCYQPTGTKEGNTPLCERHKNIKPYKSSK